MERLTINEIIEHCDRNSKNYEHNVSLDVLLKQPLTNTTRLYWEHKQVSEYLKELKRYRELEESLEKIYGDCPGLLKIVVGTLKSHSGIDGKSIKSRLLTDEDADKWLEYKQLEEQGRLLKLPLADDKTEQRECVHTKATCHHKECKCSECPLTELFCDEFYKAIDRCYEEAYASGCLAGIELGKSEAEEKLKELGGHGE